VQGKREESTTVFKGSELFVDKIDIDFEKEGKCH